MKQLVQSAGFPSGVVNVVTGDASVRHALLVSGRIDRISFTGSVGVERKIAATAGAQLVPVTLELGGKSLNIVFSDADTSKAIVGALAGIFSATGQTCIAGSRLLVQRALHDEFVEHLVKRAGAIVMGDPTDTVTEMGPLPTSLSSIGYWDSLPTPHWRTPTWFPAADLPSLAA